MTTVGSRVTVREVAAHAKVSKATAARVLGGYGPVSDTVREAVLSAAKELGYRTNALARSMATGHTRTIGVILGDIENPFFGRVARGITDAASSAGFDVIIANTDESLDTERGLVDVLVSKQVDGLIVSPANSADVEHLNQIAHIPVVFIDRHAGPESGFDAVVADNMGGGVALGEALRDRGHQHIAFLTSANPPTWEAGQEIPVSSVTDRIAGLSVGLGSAASVSIHPTAIGAQETSRILEHLLAMDKPPTALVASDSVIALHLFNALREHGCVIGRDISLCAFDNAVWTGVTDPGVTVIEQPMYEVGLRAAELLLRRVKGSADQPSTVVLPTRIIERSSIGSPRR